MDGLNHGGCSGMLPPFCASSPFRSTLERSSPHLLLLLFLLLAPTSPVERLSLVRGPRQHLHLPFSLLLFSPPVWILRRLAGSVYVFPPASSLFHVLLLLPEREHAAVKVALVPSGLCWESLSSFFKSTHPPTSRIPR